MSGQKKVQSTGCTLDNDDHAVANFLHYWVFSLSLVGLINRTDLFIGIIYSDFVHLLLILISD